MSAGVALIPGTFFFFKDTFGPLLVTVDGAPAPATSCGGDIEVVGESQPTIIKVMNSDAGKLPVFLM
jgi:hypothetical protein